MNKNKSSVNKKNSNVKDISITEIQDNINSLEGAIADPEKSIRYADKAVENRSVADQLIGLNLMGALQLIDDGKNPVPPTATMISRRFFKK